MAEKKESPAKKVLGGKKKSKKPVHKMHIRRATSGGFIAEHESMPGSEPMGPNEEHAVPNLEALQQHVAEHFSGQPEEPQSVPANA